MFVEMRVSVMPLVSAAVQLNVSSCHSSHLRVTWSFAIKLSLKENQKVIKHLCIKVLLSRNEYYAIANAWQQS